MDSLLRQRRQRGQWRRFSGKIAMFEWKVYVHILSYFEPFTSKAESLNYSKELWKNNIHFFLLIWLNSVSLCCIGFCQFWFYITIWQFVNSFWRNSISFIISNVGNQNRSKILTKEHSDNFNWNYQTLSPYLSFIK